MKSLLVFVFFVLGLTLAGCGGGGASNISLTNSSDLMPPGPEIFAAASGSASFSYYRDGSSRNPVSFMYARDLDGDGVDEILFVSFETQPNMPQNYSNTSVHILGWEDAVFKDLTSKWLSGTEGQVEGVGDACFGDFNGDGRLDVFLSAYTDMDHPVHPYALMNQGGYFDKVAFPVQAWMHAVTCADINKDGFDDVLVTGYSDFPQYVGSAGGLVEHQGMVGGSGIAVGDFLANGTVQALVVDADGAPNDTKIYALTVQSNPPMVTFQLSATLPGPRLDNRFADLGNPNSSHDIRARAVDFDQDGLLDVVVFSYRFNAPSTELQHRSEIQFLKNKGAGVFEDVTDSVRFGYDTSGYVGYFPVFRDFNQDGLVDLFVSQPDWLPSGYRSTSLLLQSSSGQFVDTWKSNLNGLIDSGGGQATMAKGPSGVFYLVKELAWRSDGLTRVSIHRVNF